MDTDTASNTTPPRVDAVAALVAIILFGVMAVVQLLLASGILPSTIAWGGGAGRQSQAAEQKEGSQDEEDQDEGRFDEDEKIDTDTDTGTPPMWMRLASIAAAGILSGMAYIVYVRINDPQYVWVKILSWVITVFMGLNTLGNLLSSNKIERYVFGSVTFVLCICCIIVSLSPLPQ